MMLYSTYYMWAYEDMSFLSSDFVYLLTMSLVSSCFAAMCGSISVLASYFFVERIYTELARRTETSQLAKL